MSDRAQLLCRCRRCGVPGHYANDCSEPEIGAKNEEKPRARSKESLPDAEEEFEEVEEPPEIDYGTQPPDPEVTQLTLEEKAELFKKEQIKTLKSLNLRIARP